MGNNPSRPRILAAVFPDDIAVEGLRSLHTALQFGVLKPGNNILMITGPRPAVGKSFVAMNLAAVVAAAGKRILLVDADMRRSDLHSYFSINNKPGLSEVLTGGELGGIIHHQVLPNLDVLMAGSPRIVRRNC